LPGQSPDLASADPGQAPTLALHLLLNAARRLPDALDPGMPDALDPGLHRARTRRIRGFMAFQLARRAADEASAAGWPSGTYH
jgi:hypothetical protein